MPQQSSLLPLESARLMLRLAGPDDAAEIAGLVDETIGAMTATWSFPMPVAAVRERLERSQAGLATGGVLPIAPTLKQATDGHPAGSIVGWLRFGPDTEDPDTISLGYWTGAAFRRQGYIEEAVRAALPVAARHFGVSRISAGALLRNPASLALLAKLGMEPVAERPSHSSARGISEMCRFFEWSVPQEDRTAGPVQTDVRGTPVC
jgi:ribosomal-protein-alanine N-acetyltransferase